MTRRVAVVGGGIGGLAAAFDLARAGCEVVVLETSDRVGGKLRQDSVGGVTVDVGAESILARRPEALDLVRDVGSLAIEHPLTTSAAIWTRDALRPMPPTVMGIPADLEALTASGITTTPVTSTAIDVPGHDVSVGSFVAERLGREVVDRLVEPLLGGVYAGHADELSLQATAPQIRALGPDLLGQAVAARTDLPPSPVFFAPTGGVGLLPQSLVAAGGFEVRAGATVRSIDRHGDGWRLLTGPTHDLVPLDVDGVVVATPAPAAARLLATLAPSAAFALADLQYASMAVVTLLLRDTALPDGSGFLVPPVDGTAIKGATFSTSKWAWSRDAAAAIAPGCVVVRASIGRAGEATLLQHDDATLVEQARADLTSALGAVGPIVDSLVQRWGGGLPQYAVGHGDLVATVEQDVATVPGLEVCGAAYAGVGIPAVVATGRGAAARLLADGLGSTQ